MVVLPASGWEMMAKVRRESMSRCNSGMVTPRPARDYASPHESRQVGLGNTSCKCRTNNAPTASMGGQRSPNSSAIDVTVKSS